jgi:hypothetical protein
MSDPAFDLGDNPTALPPTPAEQAQMRAALGLGNALRPLSSNICPYNQLTFATDYPCFKLPTESGLILLDVTQGWYSGEPELEFIEDITAASGEFSSETNGERLEIHYPAGATWLDLQIALSVSFGNMGLLTSYIRFVITGIEADPVTGNIIPILLPQRTPPTHTYPPFQKYGGNVDGDFAVLNGAVWANGQWSMPVRPSLPNLAFGESTANLVHYSTPNERVSLVLAQGDYYLSIATDFLVTQFPFSVIANLFGYHTHPNIIPYSIYLNIQNPNEYFSFVVLPTQSSANLRITCDAFSGSITHNGSTFNV